MSQAANLSPVARITSVSIQCLAENHRDNDSPSMFNPLRKGEHSWRGPDCGIVIMFFVVRTVAQSDWNPRCCLHYEEAYADDCAPRRKQFRTDFIRTGIKRPVAVTEREVSPVLFPCSTEDGGGPPGAAMQVEAPNHRKLLWPKAMVVSVTGKGPA